MYQEKPIRYTISSEASSQRESGGFIITTCVCVCLLSASEDALPAEVCECHSKIKRKDNLLSALRSYEVRIHDETALCYLK